MKKIALGVFCVFASMIALGWLMSLSEPPIATALSPCGAHQTTELKAACDREVAKANQNYREHKMADFSEKVNKAEGGE